MYNTKKQFDWDAKKAEKNRRKHGVTFDQAQRVFDDPYAIPFEDIEHSTNEPRFAMIGLATTGLLYVSFTYRLGRIRLISARRASPYMQRIYTGENN